MGGRYPPIQEPQAQRTWSGLLHPWAGELRPQARAFAERAAARVQGEVPELVCNSEASAEFATAVEGSILQFAESVDTGEDPAQIELPPVALPMVRRAVHHSVPLNKVIHSVRAARADVWEQMLALLADGGHDSPDAVALLSRWLLAYVDRFSETVEQVYEAEYEKREHTAAAAQTQMIDTILAGRPIDVSTTSQRLRYELKREHIAMIAWAEESAELPAPIASLQGALRRLATALGCEHPLFEPLGPRVMGMWVASFEPPGAERIDALRLAAEDTDVRVAVGEPAPGVSGFRRSHQDALEARRVAGLMRRPARTITRYGAVALNAIATVDLDQAQAFVARELGGLTARDDATTRIVATLGIFLDEGANHRRTARQLNIHENTVRYRIEQAEALLGRSTRERVRDLHMALSLLPVTQDDA
ncbi:MAG: helix-turn-helix domain-containing protein [Actinobacteria bacterium]|nr:helix-turn-helix domain-containing protein [Actinomycetota bacterium]